jgi:hypothetical protein
MWKQLEQTTISLLLIWHLYNKGMLIAWTIILHIKQLDSNYLLNCATPIITTSNLILSNKTQTNQCCLEHIAFIAAYTLESENKAVVKSTTMWTTDKFKYKT